jgi:DNA polymerase III subunit epsilon
VREIVLDTETTGFEPQKGHRLVEIGCLELKNHVPTGNVFHVYINPEREVPQDAANVHGLTYEFLKDHPIFEKHAQDFLAFIEDSPLVIHNAIFDMRFLNAELSKIGQEEIPYRRAIDTLKIAKQKYPGAPASLDALCKRFSIDNSSRVYHGALLDAELLAAVYLELMGGAQPDFLLMTPPQRSFETSNQISPGPSENRSIRPPRTFQTSSEEQDLHLKMLKKLKEPIWTLS